MKNFDPELLEKARWIVEHDLDKPKHHEIDRRPYLELPLPMPIERLPEKKPEECVFEF